ncbi:MAG: long-chain fatty acid--CoA ligase [Ruminococcaceae bacterium]|nr:long-chain fatty acid--CoA ligase [Oscillospiraceae bacterium]
MSKVSANPFFKFENPNSALGFDVPDTSMFGMLKISAENQPNESAYEYFGNECSYKNLVEKIEKISGAYHASGVRKGDIVTIIMPNTPEAVISIYALNRIGAVANILHPLSAQEEIKNHINRVKSKILLCVDICSEKIANIIDETPLKQVIVASAGNSMPAVMKTLYALKCIKNYKYDKSDKRYISWDEFSKKSKDVAEYYPNGDANNEVAVILHSGGTTGTPKDIMLSNRNFNAFGIQAVLTLRDVRAGDKILAILPIFHGFGLGVCVHVSFCFGACSVLIPQFNAKKFANTLKKYKPTMIFGVPTLYDALLKAKGTDKIDFSFLKYAVSGGDTLPEKLEKSVNEFLAAHNSSIKICEGYGMTEGLAALSLSVGDNYKSRTIGKPLIGTEMCIVEPGTTNILPAGEDGELCVSGPTVMIGYRNNPEETENTLRIHADGKTWLHTGDMASIDSDGFVHYKLRIKRMMITSGFNVYPTQIESVIEELDFVEKCVVVAVPHQYKKEVAKAYIVLKNGTEKSEKTQNEIREYCKKKLMHYSVPYKYEFVDLLPKTAYNKIDFMKLQKESAREAVC